MSWKIVWPYKCQTKTQMSWFLKCFSFGGLEIVFLFFCKCPCLADFWIIILNHFKQYHYSFFAKNKYNTIISTEVYLFGSSEISNLVSRSLYCSWSIFLKEKKHFSALMSHQMTFISHRSRWPPVMFQSGGCTLCLIDTLLGWLWYWGKAWGSCLGRTHSASVSLMSCGRKGGRAEQTGSATLEYNPVRCAEEQKSWFANLAVASKRPWKWCSGRTARRTQTWVDLWCAAEVSVCVCKQKGALLDPVHHTETRPVGGKRNLKMPLMLLSLINNKDNEGSAG